MSSLIGKRVQRWSHCPQVQRGIGWLVFVVTIEAETSTSISTLLRRCLLLDTQHHIQFSGSTTRMVHLGALLCQGSSSLMLLMSGMNIVVTLVRRKPGSFAGASMPISPKTMSSSTAKPALHAWRRTRWLRLRKVAESQFSQRISKTDFRLTSLTSGNWGSVTSLVCLCAG